MSLRWMERVGCCEGRLAMTSVWHESRGEKSEKRRVEERRRKRGGIGVLVYGDGEPQSNCKGRI